MTITNIRAMHAENDSEPVMNFLKNITVRRMMLIILVLFTLVWGMASSLTLYSLGNVNGLLSDNQDQKKAIPFWSAAMINILVR